MKKTPSSSHICLFLYHLEMGGAESVMVELCNGFVRHGLQVDLLLIKAKGALLLRLSQKVRVIELGSPSVYAGFPALARYLRRENPSVMLSTFELTSLLALLARRISGVSTRIVVRLATTLSDYWRPPLKKRLERLLVTWIYPSADSIVAVSQGVADDFVRFAGIEAERLNVIYNPIITDRMLQAASEPVDHPYFKSGQPPVLLGVGRLSKAKSFETLIEAFSLLHSRMPARLLILGEGEERSQLEKLIKSLGLTDEVDMPGFVENPFAYMSKAAVFVLSSRVEGLPGVLIQALACGARVVSTDCLSGPREILDGSRYGRLAPVDDAQALASAIEASLTDNQPQTPSSEWFEQFRVEAVVKRYLEVLGLPSDA